MKSHAKKEKERKKHKTAFARPLHERMSEVLAELVDNARNLKKVSLGPISEDILLDLQQKQEELMQELVQLDEDCQKTEEQPSDELSSTIQEQLLEFQKLNEEYVEHLQHHLSMIDFSTEISEKQDGL